MSLPYQRDLISRAKRLRKEATPQENALWYRFLRSYPVRFQRQKTVGFWIVDFYCHAAGLAIEIDGGQHFTDLSEGYDAERSAALARRGLLVLRYTNTEVNARFQEICEEIDRQVQGRLRSLREGTGSAKGRD